MSDRRRDERAPQAPGEVTRLLHLASRGDHDALNQVVALVYRELKSVAARYVRGERHQLTLQPTALVHEAYLQLTENRRIQWRDRAHFFAVSARLMRRILVDRARHRGARKRQAEIQIGLPVNGTRFADQETALVDLLALDAALARLASLDARRAEVVELRVFAGMSVDETAVALRLSPRTIKNDWRLARAWLSRELGAAPAP